MTRRIKMCLEDPCLPERLRDMKNWPAPMREQWGTDDGQSHSDAHRQDLIDRFRLARQALDEFQPDLCLLWGDDQYENYKEDCVPAFSILAYDSVDAQPWTHMRRGANMWDEPDDKVFTIQGHREAGKHLASSLLDNGFDVAYSYKPLHRGLGHAFVNSILYLDWDRRGFPLPGGAVHGKQLRPQARGQPGRPVDAFGRPRHRGPIRPAGTTALALL